MGRMLVRLVSPLLQLWIKGIDFLPADNQAGGPFLVGAGISHVWLVRPIRAQQRETNFNIQG